MTAYCIVSALLFLAMFAAWSKSDALNFIIKMVFGCMMVWAIACAAIRLGFHQ